MVEEGLLGEDGEAMLDRLAAKYQALAEAKTGLMRHRVTRAVYAGLWPSLRVQ